MIGCETKAGVQYITKIEDFRDLVEDSVYNALIEFINTEKCNYQEIIDDLNDDLSSLNEDYGDLDRKNDDIQEGYDRLEKDYDAVIDSINKIIDDETESDKDQIIKKLEELV